MKVVWTIVDINVRWTIGDINSRSCVEADDQGHRNIWEARPHTGSKYREETGEGAY